MTLSLTLCPKKYLHDKFRYCLDALIMIDAFFKPRYINLAPLLEKKACSIFCSGDKGVKLLFLSVKNIFFFSTKRRSANFFFITVLFCNYSFIMYKKLWFDSRAMSVKTVIKNLLSEKFQALLEKRAQEKFAFRWMYARWKKTYICILYIDNTFAGMHTHIYMYT